MNFLVVNVFSLGRNSFSNKMTGLSEKVIQPELQLCMYEC